MIRHPSFGTGKRLKFSIKIGAYEKAQGILNELKSKIHACNPFGPNSDQRIPDA
jgi:hypothetical protein